MDRGDKNQGGRPIDKMTRTILSILFIATLTVASGQVLQKFEFSDCMTECLGDTARIDSVFQVDDLTEIYLTSYANCSGNFFGQIKLTNDTLNLLYMPKMIAIGNTETGEVIESFEVTMCDCLFKFNYTIAGLHTLDKKKIKINGKTLDDINKRNLINEDTVVGFEVDSTWSSEDIFTIVEKSAEFPGGYGKFKEYIDKNLVYPKNAEKKLISGKVFVAFVINRDGSIDEIN